MSWKHYGDPTSEPIFMQMLQFEQTLRHDDTDTEGVHDFACQGCKADCPDRYTTNKTMVLCDPLLHEAYKTLCHTCKKAWLDQLDLHSAPSHRQIKAREGG